MDQSNPGNHENSADRAEELTQPSARLKQPISNTWPAGLAKVWAKPRPVFMANSGFVTLAMQLRQQMTGSSCSAVSTALSVSVSGSAILQKGITSLASPFLVNIVQSCTHRSKRQKEDIKPGHQKQKSETNMKKQILF